jgi:hypothetical protein
MKDKQDLGISCTTTLIRDSEVVMSDHPYPGVGPRHGGTLTHLAAVFYSQGNRVEAKEKYSHD